MKKKGILKRRTVLFLIAAIICIMVPAAVFAAADMGNDEDPKTQASSESLSAASSESSEESSESSAAPTESSEESSGAVSDVPVYSEPPASYKDVVIVDGWVGDDDGNRYHMLDGQTQTGFVTIDGNVYYFDENGVMQTGLQIIEGFTYYFGDDGIMRTGFQTIEDKVYYFAEGGEMQIGFQTINDRVYYFNDNGIMQTGLKTIDDSRYYFNSKGVMKTGAVKYKKKMYYFMEDGRGVMDRGWFLGLDGKKRYCYGNAKIAWGVKKIKKIWYKFNKKNGKLIRRIGDNIDKKMQGYSSSTSYMVVCKVKEHRVRIYHGKKNKWERIHKYKCTTGKASTPTRKGIYSIRSKGLYFNTGSNMRCWYWCQYSGNYLFHSVLYDRSSEPVNVVDGRLGINASHGCIRLKLKHAKYIYYNVPRGSKVVIY